MDLTRREFLGLGRGATAAAVLAGLGLAGTPRRAHAIAGVDDAVLGAVVVAMLGLGGYALYDQFSSNLGLEAVGKSFGDYVSVSSNRVAAAQAAAAIAATYGVTSTRERYENAAQSIADGTGAFADAMAQAASTGRLALDGLVSGTGDLVGAMRELVTGWFGSGALGAEVQTVPGATVIGSADNAAAISLSCSVQDGASIETNFGVSLPVTTRNGFYWWYKPSQRVNEGGLIGELFVGDGACLSCVQRANSNLLINQSGTVYRMRFFKNGAGFTTGDWYTILNATGTNFAYDVRDITFMPGVIGGPLLPGVDRSADAPDVVGTAWDTVPLATDMVISPTTGGITGAGSVPLPTGIPTTAGDYAAALQGALAGVVPGAIALPQSLSVPVTVATPTGVVTMPISEAIASETSLQLDYAPDVPITPVLPPVDVPEGPWTPAVELPFMNIWPFNMIYSFIETMGRLGS